MYVEVYETSSSWVVSEEDSPDDATGFHTRVLTGATRFYSYTITPNACVLCSRLGVARLKGNKGDYRYALGGHLDNCSTYQRRKVKGRR